MPVITWEKYETPYTPMPKSWWQYWEEKKKLDLAQKIARQDKRRHAYYQRTYEYYQYRRDGKIYFERKKKGEQAPTYDPTT